MEDDANNVIEFPAAAARRVAEPVAVAFQASEVRRKFTFSRLLAGLGAFARIAFLLCWPMLRWLMSLDVFIQFVRMLWYWNTPGVHAGATFAFHFAVLVAMTWFVSTQRQ